MRYLILILLLIPSFSYGFETAEDVEAMYEETGWSGEGNWRHQEFKDDFTDEKYLNISTYAMDEQFGLIRIICEKGKVERILVTGSDFAEYSRNYNVYAKVRFDDEDAKDEHFDIAKGHKTLIEKSPKNMIKKFLKHEKFLIGIENYKGIYRKYTFQLPGLKPVIEKFPKHCGEL